MAPAPAATGPALAYLASRLPAVSHTFILREIRSLRALGFDIRVASINDPDRPPGDLTAEEREEAAAAFYVKRSGLRGALRAHLATLGGRPLDYLAGLGRALRLGGSDLRALVYGLFYFAEAVMVGAWMRRQGRDHVHVHFANPAAMVALIAARVFPITYSLTIHGPDDFRDTATRRLAEKVAGARFVTCIGQYARSQIQLACDARHWSRIEVCPLGVDAQRFAPAPPRTADGRPFEILCVGRLAPAKAQHVLLEAVERLVAEGREVRLRLVGDGAERVALERRAQTPELRGRVVFEGAVNQDRILALYSGADAFALPSFAEGVPVVLMEAMAMELPCVATTITGVPELVRADVDGLLVPPSDVRALADALARLQDDAQLRQRLGRSGRERVLARYDLATSTERLADVFRRHLASPSRSPD